jgi:putative hydrolase of the HAD superfamily
MKNHNKIRALFVDIGGVVLTNGWEHKSRLLACQKFSLDPEQMEKRHSLTFDTYEIGKISLDEYIRRVACGVSCEEFREFMFSQSEPFEDMLELLAEVKAKHGLKVVAVSNEGRELTEYRIDKFKLDKVFDTFVSSCFVGLRKPDFGIYRLATDLAHVKPSSGIYIDDRPLFVEVAHSLGLYSIHHTNVFETKSQLERLLCMQ